MKGVPQKVFVLMTVGILLGTVSWISLAQEEIVLRFMQQGAHGGAWVEKVVADFEAAHPGVKVVVEDGGSPYLDNVTVALLGGVAPDIFQGWGAEQRSWAVNGFLLDLNPYLEKMYPNAEEMFYPGQWHALQLEKGPLAGLRFALPMYANVMGPVVYNRDALAHAGLEDPHSGWTWSDLEAYAARLVVRGDEGVERWGFVTRVDHPGWIDAWMRSAGGELFAVSDRDRFLGHTPESLEAMAYLTNLVQRGGMPPLPSDISGEVNGFLSERVAMSQMYSAYIKSTVIDGAFFDWDIAPSPVGPSGLGPAMTVVDSYSINAATRYPDLAVEFLMALKSEEAARNQLRERGIIPSTRYPEVVADLAEMVPGKNMLAYLQALNHAAPDVRSFYSNPTQTQQLLSDILRRTFQGEMPPQTGMETARQQLEGIIGQ